MTVPSKVRINPGSPDYPESGLTRFTCMLNFTPSIEDKIKLPLSQREIPQYPTSTTGGDNDSRRGNIGGQEASHSLSFDKKSSTSTGSQQPFNIKELNTFWKVTDDH